GGLGHVWWDAAPCASIPCSDSDRLSAAAQMARAVAYNLGLRDSDPGSTAVGGFDPKAGIVVPATTPELMAGGAWPGAGTVPPLFLDPAGAGGFEVKAPFPAGTTRVALISHDPVAGDVELTALTASDSDPAVAIVSPSTGDAWQGKRIIQWTGSDPGGASLVYA